MKKKWQLKKGKRFKKRRFPELEKASEKILLNRGFENERDLEVFFAPDYEKDLHDPFLLNDMKKAVKRTLEAKKKKETVCIFGDYDADGVTSSVLLSDFLGKELKVENFCYIPERETEGYGLNKKALEYIKKQGADLVITVDCGVANAEEIEYGQSLGLEFIVLDHHDVVRKIPPALAVIDPKNPNEKKYPFKSLAGVGVVFKFVQAVARKSKDIKEEKLKWYLDLVAVGTIADCVPLLDENRTLVRFGLMVLAKTKRPGLRQLFQVGRMKIGEGDLPKAEQVAFQVAPRINAAGRMKHANIASKLLLEKNEARAFELAKEIEAQNKDRQNVTAEIIKKVKKEIDSLKKIPKIIIESSSKWKIGIVGLSAGRLAEEYSRPVILLQENKDVARGSGRSIPGFNLLKALKRQDKFLTKYGGHNQAVGLTLALEDLDKFKEAFLKKEGAKVLVDDFKIIPIDAQVEIEEINNKLCEEISMLEPFGKENEMPNLLVKGVELVNKKLLGNGEKHLKLWVKDESKKILEAIGFGMGEEWGGLKIGEKIDLVFNLEKNCWNGTECLQLKLVDCRKNK